MEEDLLSSYNYLVAGYDPIGCKFNENKSFYVFLYRMKTSKCYNFTS